LPRSLRIPRVSPHTSKVRFYFEITGVGIDEELYRKFEEKSLDEQADEITHDLLWGQRNLLFDFDNQDQVQREEYIKELIGAGIFFTMVTAIDLRVLNGMKAAKAMGPLRKFVFLNILQLPFYAYFYYKINTRYMDLKKFMV
jgi:hypothetical protein